MKNTYEFNIEDINSVIIITKDSTQYTTTFTRKFKDNKPTEEFIETYSANDVHNDNTIITKQICERCGTWYDVNPTRLDYRYKCESCTSDYEDIVSEDELIERIYSFMNDEMFLDVMIFINGRQIE